MTQATPNANSEFSRCPPRPLPGVYTAATLWEGVPPMVPFVRAKKQADNTWLPTGPIMAKWDDANVWVYDTCKAEPIGSIASDVYLARIDRQGPNQKPTHAEFWNALPVGAYFLHTYGTFKKIDIDRYQCTNGYGRGTVRNFWHQAHSPGFFGNDTIDLPNESLSTFGEPPMPATPPPPSNAGEFWDSLPIGARFAFADGRISAPAPYTKISSTHVEDCHGDEFPFFMDPGVGCRHFYASRSELLHRHLRILGETEPATARPYTSRCCYTNFPNEAAARPPDTCLRRHYHCAKCCTCNRCRKCMAEFKDAKPCPNKCGSCVACCTCPERYGRFQASFRKRSLKFHAGQPCALAPSARMAAAELEYIGCHDNKPIDAVCALWGHSVCADGSLPPDTGFEINTQPASGGKLVKMIEDICTALGEGNASVDGRCGIHIHVDVRDFGPQEIQRLALIYAVVENGIFMLQPSSRKSGGYCIPCGDKLTTGLRERLTDEQIVALLDRAIYENNPYVSDCKRSSKPHGRYKAMNLHSWNFRKTVEFRHAAGSRDFEKILFWMTLLINLCDQAKAMDLNEALALHEKKPVTAWENLLNLSPTDECKSWMGKRAKELKASGGVDVSLSDNPYHH